MKKPDEKHWHGDWTPRESDEILSIAGGLQQRDGVDDRAAWRAAEEVFARGTDRLRDAGGMKHGRNRN